MAARVFNGSGNAVYVNSSGKNARVIINIMDSTILASVQRIVLAIGSVTHTISNNSLIQFSIGKNVAGVSQYESALSGSGVPQNIQGGVSNLVSDGGDPVYTGAVPVEFMVPDGTQVSWQCGNYNIVAIDEN
jgi:hypothetical protein